MVKDMAKALSHIHAKGIVHRDIKPANIFLKTPDHILIGDFGVGKVNSNLREQNRRLVRE